MAGRNKTEPFNRLEELMAQQTTSQHSSPCLKKKVRACVYIRITSDAALFTGKDIVIRNYYSHLFSKHDDWILEDLFQDERHSTSEFNMMIRNSKKGKYDIIITPSFMRFHSNPIVTASAVKDLKELAQPVGIYFDIEDLLTLEDNADIRVNSLLLFAEQKREQKKGIIRWSSRVKEYYEPTEEQNGLSRRN